MVDYREFIAFSLVAQLTGSFIARLILRRPVDRFKLSGVAV